MEYVSCPSCKATEDDILIVTPARHTSDYEYGVEIQGNHYKAYNSDGSWSADDEKAKFHCRNCQHNWPVDKDITWEWND